MSAKDVKFSADAREKMLSVDGDIGALTEVIRLWLTRYKRWGSAVYLAGESYGTTRGAAIGRCRNCRSNRSTIN